MRQHYQPTEAEERRAVLDDERHDAELRQQGRYGLGEPCASCGADATGELRVKCPRCDANGCNACMPGGKGCLCAGAALFERTAEAMRADLRAEGWTELPNTTPERWRSGDRKRVLPLVDAWSRARRDAEASTRPLDPPHETVVDRSADFVQPPANDLDAQAPGARTGRD